MSWTSLWTRKMTMKIKMEIVFTYVTIDIFFKQFNGLNGLIYSDWDVCNALQFINKSILLTVRRRNGNYSCNLCLHGIAKFHLKKFQYNSRLHPSHCLFFLFIWSSSCSSCNIYYYSNSMDFFLLSSSLFSFIFHLRQILTVMKIVC